MANGDDPEKSNSSGAEGSTALGYLKTAADKLLPLAVSAVVSVGFVAFAGKAVLWTRFYALQVPADQVVKVVPQSEAVSTGASMLLIFGLLGALAALAVYLLDRPGRATLGMSRGLLVIVGVEGIVAIWLAEGKSAEARILASEVLVLAVAAIFWATFVGDFTRHDDEPECKPPPPKPEAPELDCEPKPPKPLDRPPGAFFQRGGKSGITGMGLFFTCLLAAALGAAGYVLAVTILSWPHEVGWAVAVGGIALGLVSVLVWHVCRFNRKAKSECEAWKADWKRWQAEEKACDEKKSRAEQDKKAAEARPATRRAGRLAALGRALGDWRRDRSLVTVNVATPAGTKTKAAGGVPDKQQDDRKPEPPGFTLKPLGIGVTVVLAAVAVGVPSLVLHEWWIAVSLGAIAVLGVGLWRIASLSKEKFVWYGLAVFISVPFFGTVMLVARNIDEPQVQPMALIRETDGPDEAIQGLYVTETSDRVYFANVATEGCRKKVTPHSGRLLSVPTNEVVAMSIGPLQGIREASLSALEMSYALTPAVETGSGTVDLPGSAAALAKSAAGETSATGGTSAGGPEKAEEKGGEAAAAGPDKRLENVGPAVRPNFGSGLRLEPEVVEPGGEATLRMSEENPESEGFGPAREGRNLRLGGRLLDISKEPAGAAEGAEYIELEKGRLIVLGKGGAYFKEGPGKFVPEAEADSESGGDADADDEGAAEGPFVKLEDPQIQEFEGPEGSDGSEYVEVREGENEGEGAKVVGRAEVTLAGGFFQGRSQERDEVALEGLPLTRQAWHSDHIRFHVPDDSSTGVVTVECGQLAGSPLLQVRHAPMARIAVTAPPRKSVLTFNGSASTAGPPAHAPDAEAAPPAGTSSKARKAAQEPLTRRWKVDGVRQGDGKKIHERMPPRMAPYTVELTVTDREGNVDRAKLEVLRLPAGALKSVANAKTEQRERAWERRGAASEAIEEAVSDERPSAIELDGYTSSPGKVSHDVLASLRKDDFVRKHLLHEAKEEAEGEEGEEESPAEAGIAVEELGHGDGCPLRRHSSPADLHVDVFLLHQGVLVKPVEGCHPLGRKSAVWHPPPVEPSAGASAAPNAGASSAP